MIKDKDVKRGNMKRVFLIVLDSFGIGEMEDAASYGDKGTNTLRSVAESPFLHIPNMCALGLGNLDGVDCLEKEERILGRIARMKEASKGKDTTIGHWEIAGVLSMKPMPTYPNGFPKEVLDAFCKATGRGVLCNKPYSGTVVIEDYGKQHMETGDLIVYTSGDSVFQIAAHEDIVPVETLYEYCHIARNILVGEHAVGRVIARPFVGEPGHFTRTSGRHDYAVKPPKDTLLDVLKNAGKTVIGVGKIHDIFSGQGLSEYVFTTGNEDGIEKTLEYMKQDFEGLCFVNLVDFDMLYGHRRNVDGYAKALTYFDEKLPQLMAGLREDDILMITADHGCDPAYPATNDHTREHTPFLMYGNPVEPGNLGTRETFADIAATILDYFDIPNPLEGASML